MVVYDKEHQTEEIQAILLHLTKLDLPSKTKIKKNERYLNFLDVQSGVGILTSLAYSHQRTARLGQALESDEIINYLVKCGANLNQQTTHRSEIKQRSIRVRTNGETVLHAVARTGYVEAFSVLLRNGARLDIEDADGKTPMDCVPEELQSDFKTALDQHYMQHIGRLHETAKRGDDKTLKKILDGAIRLSDDNGITALMEAAKGQTEGHLRCIRHLYAKAYADDIGQTYLAKKAPGTNKTSLHIAAECSPEAYRILCGYDENEAIQNNAEDSNGKTPRQIYQATMAQSNASISSWFSRWAGSLYQTSDSTNEISPLVERPSSPYQKVK